MGGGIMVCPVLQWVPVLEKGMEAVPEGTHVRFGQLQSPFQGSLELAHNRFLSIELRNGSIARSQSASDVRVVVGEKGMLVGSLAGYVQVPYWNGYVIDLDAQNLLPWWLSRKGLLFVMGWMLAAVMLVVSWVCLSLLYVLPLGVLIRAMKRLCSRQRAFKLALIGLFPGAVLASIATLLYGLGYLPLQEYLLAMVLHLPFSWIWILLALRALPPSGLSPNPFVLQTTQDRRNPFLR